MALGKNSEDENHSVRFPTSKRHSSLVRWADVLSWMLEEENPIDECGAQTITS